MRVDLVPVLTVYSSATGTFLFGYDSGIIASVISDEYDQFQTYFNAPNAAITGAIVSVFAGGAFCESSFSLFISSARDQELTPVRSRCSALWLDSRQDRPKEDYSARMYRRYHRSVPCPLSATVRIVITTEQALTT